MVSATINHDPQTNDHTIDTVAARPGQEPYIVSLPGDNPSTRRKPFIPSPSGPLTDAGVPRANIAASVERPNGSDPSWKAPRANETVLQQHASYWDTDHDGIIWPLDTYRGFRKWGWNPLLCLVAAAFINIGLAYPSGKSWLPDLFFRIHVSRLHKDHHGSTTGTYDSSGRFRPQAFEDIFAQYDADGKGGLNKADLWRLWRGQAMLGDVFGQLATALEWAATYLLIWPEDGVLRKEDVRGIYDGSIFETKAREYAAKQGDATKRANGKRS